MAITLRTADVPADQRFAFWRELANKSHAPTILETTYDGDWDATSQIHDFGTIMVTRQRNPPLTARRPPRLIRQSDPEALYLMVPTVGRMIAQQGDRVAEHGPESFVVLDTSAPVTFVSPTATDHFILHIPRPVLPAQRRFGRGLARPINAHRGLGGALIHLVREVARDDQAYPAVALSQMTQAIVDLFVAVQIAAEGDVTRVPPESRDRARILQILGYMRAHLSDTSLDLARVARAHNLSLRQLSRLFQAEGTQPGAWLREQRLLRCRRDLTDPAQTATPAAAIGARWGFTDPVTFTRAFTRAFGLPPGEYRRQFTPPEGG